MINIELRRAYWRRKSNKYRAKNPDRVRENHRRSREKPENREKQRIRDKKWRLDNWERENKISRERGWKNVGILNEHGEDFSHVEYDRMYQVQQGRCLICNVHQTELKRTLFLDHCHKTGKARGLLCQPCNSKLGILENEEFCKAALEYVRRSTCQQPSL